VPRPWASPSSARSGGPHQPRSMGCIDSAGVNSRFGIVDNTRGECGEALAVESRARPLGAEISHQGAGAVISSGRPHLRRATIPRRPSRAPAASMTLARGGNSYRRERRDLGPPLGAGNIGDGVASRKHSPPNELAWEVIFIQFPLYHGSGRKSGLND
jgi:hypothetical protein